jgi:hypothetical protein
LTHPLVAETIRRMLLKAAAAEHLVSPARSSGPAQASLDFGATP